MAPRQYELVHIGATGYTGAYTLTHICNILPTNLKWAIAGRSRAKLEAVIVDLRKRFPDRIPPAIEVCQQEDADMDRLAAKTTIIITTVGPFCRYGEPVVKACAKNGTGYIDSTGEVPWVKMMVDKYHEEAKRTGAIIIPQCAVESAISDLFAYALVGQVRERFATDTKSVTSLLWDIQGVPSGGTLATVFSLFDIFSTKYLLNAMQPYALSPVPRAPDSYPARGGLGALSGMMQVPKLGLAVNSGLIMGVTNAAIVWRTWGLFQQAATDRSAADGRTTRSSLSKEGLNYGPQFHYTEVRKAHGRIKGFLYHILMSTLPVLFFMPPVRWLLRRLVFQPGQGPAVETTQNDRIELRGVAKPTNSDGKYVVGRVEWKGSPYDITGLCMVHAAKVMLQIYKERAEKLTAANGDCYARRESGGILTPACLGEPYLESVKTSQENYRLHITEE